MVPKEGAPALAALARRPPGPHVLLNRSFADADAELQQLSADALRTPQHVVARHRLDERDELRGEPSGLAPESGPMRPDDLEQVSVRAQERVGRDQVQSRSPSAGQSRQEKQEQAIENPLMRRAIISNSWARVRSSCNGLLG